MPKGKSGLTPQQTADRAAIQAQIDPKRARIEAIETKGSEALRSEVRESTRLGQEVARLMKQRDAIG